MKQGSADDPFADNTGEDTDDAVAADELGDTTETTPTTDAGGQGSAPPQQRSLPYIHSRNGVKDGRTQRPVFLREHIETGIDDLVAQVEADIGEDVYKTDVTEAAMAVAQEHPDLVREKLIEWGYGWD
jgi:hypothetical protein